MYWPKVSVKKQLELEVIKTSLKNQAIRKSAQDLEAVKYDEEGNPIREPKPKVGLGYEKPWRDAMSKKPPRSQAP